LGPGTVHVVVFPDAFVGHVVGLGDPDPVPFAFAREVLAVVDAVFFRIFVGPVVLTGAFVQGLGKLASEESLMDFFDFFDPV
jgi:hypothetical protein